MTAARDSPDERALHLTTESPAPPSRGRGALIGLNDQGFDCIPSNPRSRSRVTCSERPILEPGNREVEIGLTGRHLTAERSTHPGRKGARIFLASVCAAPSFRGGCADTYGSLAQDGRRPGGSDSARMSQGLRAYPARRQATLAESNVEGRRLTQGP